MATISENLQILNETKAAIKTVIESKGQDLSSVPFTEYADAIINVIEEYEEKYKNTRFKFFQNLACNFGEPYHLTEEDLEGCENLMNYRFYTNNLCSIKIPASVARMGGSLFAGCMFPTWEGETDEDMNAIIPKTVLNVQNWLFGNSGVRKVKIYRPPIYVQGITESSYDNWFTSCSKLEYLEMTNIRWDLIIKASQLKEGCMVNLIRELIGDEKVAKKLTIHTGNLEEISNIYVKLIDITDEMISTDAAIEAKLPFEVCESTDEGAMLITDYVALKNWTIST